MINKKKIVYLLVVFIIFSILISLLFFLNSFKPKQKAPTGMALCGGSSCNLGVALVICENCTCIQNWTCTAWSTCQTNNFQTRICTDLNNCANQSEKPYEIQSCTYTSSANSQSSSSGTGTSRESNITNESMITIDVVETNLDIIQVELSQDEIKNQTIIIRNTGNKTLNISLETENIDKIVSFSDNEFSLGPGEEKEIIIEFYSSENKENYGSIFIKSNNIILKTIPTKVSLTEKIIYQETPSLEQPATQEKKFELPLRKYYWIYVLLGIIALSSLTVFFCYLLDKKK